MRGTLGKFSQQLAHPGEHRGECGCIRQVSDTEVVAIRDVEADAGRHQDMFAFEQFERERLVIEPRQTIGIDPDECIECPLRLVDLEQWIGTRGLYDGTTGFVQTSAG